MIIGISTRNLDSKYGIIKGVPTTYTTALKDVSFLFIDSEMELNTFNKKYLNNLLSIVDGVILPGGDSVSKVDDYLINYAYYNNIPLMGICLGMQEIALHFTSSLERIDTPSHFSFTSPYLHYINIKEDSYLHKILKDKRIAVNSKHRYKIKENDKYEVVATSDDNVIEGIKVKDTYYIVGYQFHPEIMEKYDMYAKLIFNDFIDKIKSN